MPHSPTPWAFKEADGDEIIEDANGRRVHYDTQYYPSGLDSDDARFIVRSVNRVAELEGVLACLLVSYEASFGNVEDALAKRARALVPDWRERADEFDPTKS